MSLILKFCVTYSDTNVINSEILRQARAPGEGARPTWLHTRELPESNAYLDTRTVI